MKIDFKKNQNYINRKNCSLCNETNLKDVLNFNKTPLANSYKKKIQKEIFAPLKCVICENCKHLQLKHIVNPKLLFQNYLYVTGTSDVLIKHFKDYSNKIIKKKKLNLKKDKILDIACNDGTFLYFFKKLGFKNIVGVEPAKNLRELNLKKKIDVNTFYFNYKNSFRLKKKYNSFKIITANNVFAHVPNLRNFALGVKNILSHDGLFIFEVSYLKDVISKLTFDTIYHEHMSYHSLKPLISFFKSIDMEVIDFDLISAQGGSIRVYVSKNKKSINQRKIVDQIEKEKNMGLFKNSTYLNFYKRIKKHKKKLKNYLKKNIVEQNKILVGYGAPAKVTTFSYVFGITTKYLTKIVDDNKLKQNRFTPGRHFKIINFEILKKQNFDYIIIFAWNFSQSISQKLLKKFKKKKKFKIITPFPKLRITK